MRPAWKTPASTVSVLIALIGPALMGTVLIGCSSGTPAADVSASTSSSQAPQSTPVTFEVLAHGVDSDQTFRTTGASSQLRYGNGRLSGQTSIDGEPATAELLAQVGYENGSGPFNGYWTFTFADSSSLVLSYSGQTTKQGTDTSIAGELTVFGGSGRFSAVTGAGTVTGERRAELGADVNYRFTLNLAGLPR